jgi:hypothetical protein
VVAWTLSLLLLVKDQHEGRLGGLSIVLLRYLFRGHHSSSPYYQTLWWVRWVSAT